MSSSDGCSDAISAAVPWPPSGRGMELCGHMAEGNLVKGQRSRGVNLTSWPLVDLLSHGVMSPYLDQIEKGSKGILYLWLLWKAALVFLCLGLRDTEEPSPHGRDDEAKRCRHHHNEKAIR